LENVFQLKKIMFFIGKREMAYGREALDLFWLLSHRRPLQMLRFAADE
jgi:hypothetical protein